MGEPINTVHPETDAELEANEGGKGGGANIGVEKKSEEAAEVGEAGSETANTADQASV